MACVIQSTEERDPSNVLDEKTQSDAIRADSPLEDARDGVRPCSKKLRIGIVYARHFCTIDGDKKTFTEYVSCPPSSHSILNWRSEIGPRHLCRISIGTVRDGILGRR